MQIKILVSVAGDGFSFAPNDVATVGKEIDKDEAERFIKGGIAEAVRPAPRKKETK